MTDNTENSVVESDTNLGENISPESNSEQAGTIFSL